MRVGGQAGVGGRRAAGVHICDMWGWDVMLVVGSVRAKWLREGHVSLTLLLHGCCTPYRALVLRVAARRSTSDVQADGSVCHGVLLLLLPLLVDHA